MPEADPLLLPSQWTCVSLRPEGQHREFEQLCHSQQYGFLACSSLRLEKRASEDEIDTAIGCDIVIATSPSAIRFAQTSPRFKLQAATQYFAIGPSSAKAWQALGVSHVRYSQTSLDSEGLLAMPELQQVTGKRIGILTAPGGLGLLAPRLLARGAEVHLAEVYQRTPIAIDASTRDQLLRIPPPLALFCSSYEAFLAFWQGFSASQQAHLARQHWVLSSDRIATHLSSHQIRAALITHSAVPRIMFEHFIHAVHQHALR